MRLRIRSHGAAGGRSYQTGGLCGILPVVSLRVWLRLLQRRRLIRLGGVQVLALLGFARSPRNGNVLVDVIVQGKVALGDGVGAVGLVLVDQLMHVRSEDMLGVLVDILFVGRLSEDG